ncbi:hypothetical protein [Sutcliffiella deserti]|uniref:hypothetical protein n=1 Tax=Sutcliffiella deserti TaxID=2875501 RepID=UPI001CBD5E16|nr:hypothetical protein [Sutcliffiella deserti]
MRTDKEKHEASQNKSKVQSEENDVEISQSDYGLELVTEGFDYVEEDKVELSNCDRL